MNQSLKKIILISFCMFSVSLQANIFKILGGLGNVVTYEKGLDLKFVDQNSVSAQSFSKLQAYADNLSKKLNTKMPTLLLYTSGNSAVEYNLMASPLNLAKKDPVLEPTINIGVRLIKRWEEGWFADSEMEAFLAHETCHLLYNHPLKCGLMNVLISGPGLFSKINIGGALGPKALMKNAYSRRKEKEADLKAITILEQPRSLATGLVKMHCLGQYNPETKEAFEQKYQEMLASIKNDERGFSKHIKELLIDHPILENRVEYIEKNQ